MPNLLRSPYVVIEHRVASRLVCVTRTDLEFAAAAEARSEVATWAAVVLGLPTSAELGLLLDWRRAPLTTDKDVLREVVRGTNELGLRFARFAVLLESVLGDLQARRLRRLHETAPEVFCDEAKAYEYVTSR